MISQNAVSLLNAVLLASAPNEQPPPRRSKRSVGDEEHSELPSPKKRQAASFRNKCRLESLLDDDNNRGLTSEELILLLSTANDVNASATQQERFIQECWRLDLARVFESDTLGTPGALSCTIS